jgi:hypothetical protein
MISPDVPASARTTLTGINPARFSWVELQLVTPGLDPSPGAPSSGD